MAEDRIRHSLARLEAAITRAEAAALQVADMPQADPAEFAELIERHDRLKHSVANSLRQLDVILADIPQAAS